MRHQLVLNLQPIGMIYEVLDRRLRTAHPDLAHVRDGTRKINGFARAALNACLDVVTWLAPQEGAGTTAAEGARECVGLLATSLSFRGYALRNEVAQSQGLVGQAAMRNVLTAALMHATDELPAPAELQLCAQPKATGLEVTLTARATPGAGGWASEASYRCLSWADVQALAAAESVALWREEGCRIGMLFPWVQAAPT
jgi:hypothetical protein